MENVQILMSAFNKEHTRISNLNNEIGCFSSPHSAAYVLSDHCDIVNVSRSMLLKSFHIDWCSWVHSVSHEYRYILTHPLWLHIYMDFCLF